MGTTKFLVYALLFAQGQAPAFKVIPGIKHSSITLSTSFDPRSVKEVTWNQKTPKAQWQVAKNGHMTSVLNERFSQTHNGTRLVINNLTETDNGVYRAEATLEDGTMNQEYFNVTVYDPVPQPQIILHVNRIGDQYNVTFQCFVPSNTSDLSYIWTYRLRGSENWSTENDTSSIQMMLPPDQNMELICTVYNSVDRKNVSFYYPEGMTKRSHISSLVAMVTSIILVAAMLYSTWKEAAPVQETNYTTIEIPHGKNGITHTVELHATPEKRSPTSDHVQDNGALASRSDQLR